MPGKRGAASNRKRHMRREAEVGAKKCKKNIYNLELMLKDLS